MGEQKSKSSGMMRGFVPGMISGLIVGAFLGAVIPPFLDSKELPKLEDGVLQGSAGDRQRDDRGEDYNNQDYDEIPIDDEMSDQAAPAENAESDAVPQEPADGDVGNDGP